MTHLGWVASTASNQETDTRNSHQVKRRLPEETNLAYQVDNWEKKIMQRFFSCVFFFLGEDQQLTESVDRASWNVEKLGRTR